jgi:diaminohydroxyphosphoribosylaminopyrimidine deaminase/5-amino-6-(5-phosphoribosylamino)uracil reductase
VVGERDTFFMRTALQLAERGRGGTSPNPMVGALVVDRDGVIVGRGAHEVAGGPHAEVYALIDAGERARGATLYCTLEPCSHQGRTGPCAPLVVQAGIARAVVATEDPNPVVAGRGNALLRAHGVDVLCGVRGEEAARLNAPFFTVMRCRRPYVTLKIATSLDGRIAAAAGARTPMTGPAANRHVHQLRAEVDAIAIGSGTLLTDDPVLTPRVAYRRRPLVRIVFDRRLRTPPGAALLGTLATGPVIIITSSEMTPEGQAAASRLEAGGAAILRIAPEAPLRTVLETLVTQGVTSLVVEGGTTLHRSFWDAGLVDRVQMYVTPRTVGTGGVRWLEHPVVSDPSVVERQARPLGEDVLIEAYVHRTD